MTKEEAILYRLNFASAALRRRRKTPIGVTSHGLPFQKI